MPHIHYKNYKGITSLARDLRRNQTPSEKILWDVLRKKRVLGYKFLRQHPVFYHADREWVEFYVADFYCAELKLIIEVDGSFHSGREEYDNERDSKLLNKGIQVIRIKNEELKNIDSFKSKLYEIMNSISSQDTANKSHTSPSLKQ